MLIPNWNQPETKSEVSTELNKIVYSLTPTQIEYLSALICFGDIDAACKESGIGYDTVVSWGEERQVLLSRAAQLAQVSRFEAVKSAMEYYAIRAVGVMARLMDSEDEGVQYNAAKVFIEHILGKPKTKAEISTQRRDVKMYVNLQPEQVLDAWNSGIPE